MNEEEKEAIEMFEFCSRYNCVLDGKRTKIILNLIKQLQKENEKYKQFFNLMLRLDSDYFMNCGDEETIKLVDEILKLESE